MTSSPVSSRAIRVLGPLAFPLALVVIGLGTSQNLHWLYLATAGAIGYVLTVGFNVSFGYAGVFNLSLVAIYGLGAFTSIYLEMHVGLNFWITIPVAIAVCVATSLLIAAPSRRLNELFLAIETIAFALALNELLQNWDTFSGGTTGLYGVPVPELFGVELLGGQLPFYWLTAAAAWLAYSLTRRLDGSGLGRKFVAYREGPRVLASVGASPGTVNLTAFAISGGLAGLAGILFARFGLFVSLDQFGFGRLIVLLLATILGGAGRLWGPLYGVMALLVMDETSTALGQDYELIFGLTIIVIIAAGRGGLAGLASHVWGRVRPRDGVVSPSPQPSKPDVVGGEPRTNGHVPNVPVPGTATASDETLEVNDVRVAFGGTRAVNGVDLTLRRGEVVGLIGPNGAGKTSLVNAITGDVYATGSARIGGQELIGMRPESIVRLGLSRTFQSPHVVPELTIVENVMLARDALGGPSSWAQFVHGPACRQAEAQIRQQARGLLANFGLSDVEQEETASQTYGVLRLAEVVRNLMLHPRFLLLDEPGAGLTESERDQLGAHIAQLSGQGIGVLLIDHNVELITKTCDRVYVMDEGHVIEEGTPTDVFAADHVVSAYLGVPL